MKKYFNIVFFILFLSTPVLSQVSKWRTDPPKSTSQPNNSSGDYRTTPMDGYSSWRSDPPKDLNISRPTKPGSNILISDPFFNGGWGWNRWNMWGAPMFGYDYWLPYRYYNDWGYREPARIYVYNDGKRDTIMGKKPKLSFGVQYSTNREIGGWMTIGNKVYFIIDASKSHEIDKSTYFPYGNLSIVDFPLVDDYVKTNNFYFGLGRKFNRTGIHMMVGRNNETTRWRGKDNLGYITFPKQMVKTTTMKFGIIHDFKSVSTKFDIDPIIGTLHFGVGFNL